MTEALKGNTKHKALKSKQIQNTNDQMTKTFRIWSEATLGFSVSARDELGRVDLGFNPRLNYVLLFKTLHSRYEIRSS
jgi:hypothetical protein